MDGFLAGLRLRWITDLAFSGSLTVSFEFLAIWLVLKMGSSTYWDLVDIRKSMTPNYGYSRI
ncbi:unnamed protein product [Haemonchus placei]|uniref:Bestrophin homolog n=1 Tax=Haemonchus placei TaxID=6290 RepID=A0A0N4WL02_HAEPC|nr:unnamed protein product [Haemonchus placei]